MKPTPATTFLIAFVALILLATETRNISAWRGLIQPTVAANHSSLAAIAVDPPLTPQGNLEYDTNRYGSDYKSFELSQADPAICRNECANDSTCRAFTYVKPGVQGAKARCWLKNAVPQASANSCCVSGIKSGGGSGEGLEVNVNRRGGDYRDYDLPSNNPNQCREDCLNDSRCQSFTFLRPSYWGPNAHCFLKNSVPNATQETCCISGVKAGGGGGSGGGSNSGGTKIGWGDSARDYRDQVGKRFSFYCPPNPHKEGKAAGGTDVYLDDSGICIAAVHAGAITFAAGGTVRIEMRSGQDSYQGSERNGVSTYGFGHWPGSFVVVR